MDEQQRRRIKEAVLDILKASNLEKATVGSVRAAATEKLGFELSSLAQRQFVQQLVDRFLLSTAASTLETPSSAKGSGGGDNPVLKEERNPQQQPRSSGVGSQGNSRSKVVVTLSEKRWVTIHDLYGRTVVGIRDFVLKDGNMLPSRAQDGGVNLTRQQWSLFRNRFSSVDEAIVKLESRLGKHAVHQQKNRSRCSEAVREAGFRKSVADSAADRSRSSVGASHLTSTGTRKRTESEVTGSAAENKLLKTSILSPTRIVQAPFEASRQGQVANEVRTELIPIQPTRFDGRNFHCWRHRMELSLNQLNIAYVLTEPTPSIHLNAEASSDEKVRIRRWNDDDYLCRHHILNSLCDSIFQTYSLKVQSARQLWEELRAAYNEDFGTKISQVYKYIHFQMVDGFPILEQINELQNIANSIKTSGIMIDDTFHVSAIISKLPPSWKDFRARLMKDDEFLPIKMLMDLIKVEEEYRSCHKKEYKNSHDYVEKRDI
ncbi:uncharacterized protein LOC127261716 [Andrographis paniculata]|uniref:uncharacterized protein LOC127261716 n=1 Tax=Andrographis paniculata TaxID=175694 RepID=UPI0021E78B7E|nr:uncharacterized protein LOC127261716 [Andrographis paniculata]